MTDRVEVRGLQTLRATLHGAAEALQELQEAPRAAGAIVSLASRGAAPRRSGLLSGSISSTVRDGAAVIRSPLRYAGVIHWGWPARNIQQRTFISDSARGTEGRWIKSYEAEIQDILDKVHGV